MPHLTLHEIPVHLVRILNFLHLGLKNLHVAFNIRIFQDIFEE
jgi:hypothetical protein